MKTLAALALALLPAQAVPQALAPNSTLYSSAPPPMRFRGDTVATVIFLRDVSRACGTSVRPGYVILACAKGSTIVMPDPCILADREFYARIMCHEISHVRGWPATHGD